MAPGALASLRRLAGEQQFLTLKQSALAASQQTPAAFPLLALAYAGLEQAELAASSLDQYQSLVAAGEELPDAQALADVALVRLRIGDTLLSQQVLDDAIQQLQAQHENLPVNLVQRLTVQIRMTQLEIWLALEQNEQAESWLDLRREDIPEQEWQGLVSGFARLLAGKDRHEQAEEQLRRGLKAYPEALSLVAQLAELVQVQGRTGQAIQLLRRAIRVAENRSLPQAGLWLQLGRACLHNATPQARWAVEKGLALLQQEDETAPVNLDVHQADTPLRRAPLYWQFRTLQAMVDSQEQQFDAAEQTFQEILAEHPQFVVAMQGLAQQYMQLGKVDEAIALYERIRELDPAAGFSGLINARRFPEDDETLERLEAMARKPGLEGHVRSGLLFQLASAWEKREDYDRAFALAQEANGSAKKHLSYDPVKHRQSCARVRYAFSKSLYQHRKDCGSDSQVPVFVVGMPRSGTTLVEQILASHSKIFGAGELGVIPQRIQGLNRWERHCGSGREYPDCVDDLTPHVVEGIANGIVKELQELAAEDKPEALHVVDKLPHNFENVGLIKFLFPNARIISVRRDPRDIAMSNYFIDFQAKHGGMGFAYDLGWVGQQLADHNLFMHHWNQVFPGEILELQYEQLLADPEGQARRMLDYIGVDWETQVLEYNKLDRAVKTASVWQVRQPIYQTSKAKWKRYQSHLAPLIQGTNAKIEWQPVSMVTLPQPGFLTNGVALYRDGKLDDAEMSFKKMLHHNPGHLACQYMVGLIYCRKGHLQDGIALMEPAVEKAPWHREWKENLAMAYELSGDYKRVEDIRHQLQSGSQPTTDRNQPDLADDEASNGYVEHWVNDDFDGGGWL